jgi:hypothetical protein
MYVRALHAPDRCRLTTGKLAAVPWRGSNGRCQRLEAWGLFTGHDQETGNEDAVSTMLAAGPQYRLLATNTLRSEGRTLSSLGVSGNQLFLRTPTHLYCIAKKEQ